MLPGSQSVVDARLKKCKWELKSSQGTTCQPMLSNWSTQKGHLLQFIHPFSIWIPHRGPFLAPEGSLFLLCTKVYYVLAVALKVNSKRWHEGKSVYLVLDGMGGGKIKDC